jgi:hypothetical protein
VTLNLDIPIQLLRNALQQVHGKARGSELGVIRHRKRRTGDRGNDHVLGSRDLSKTHQAKGSDDTKYASD